MDGVQPRTVVADRYFYQSELVIKLILGINTQPDYTKAITRTGNLLLNLVIITHSQGKDLTSLWRSAHSTSQRCFHSDRIRQSLFVSDGTVELEVVLHLNIQGNLNLENDFLHITLISDRIFQQLVQDAHDVYYLVLRHRQSKFPWFLADDRYFHPRTTKQRQNVSYCQRSQ